MAVSIMNSYLISNTLNEFRYVSSNMLYEVQWGYDMKKILYCVIMFLLFQFGLRSNLFHVQQGVSGNLMAQETAGKEEELKRPKGISDLEWEQLKGKREMPYDKGPATIDVSSYTKKMQDIYKKDFQTKCSKCHTVARAVNAPYALSDEWKNYIRKMMKKPGSGINPASAKKIFNFLVYDSEIRKKDLIEKKLKEKG